MIVFLLWWGKKRNYFSALSGECYNGHQRTGAPQKSFATILGYDQDLIRTWIMKVEDFLAGSLQTECSNILVVPVRFGHVKHQGVWGSEALLSSSTG